MAIPEPSIITEDNWPSHPDGRKKSICELTHEQHIAVVRGAMVQMRPELQGAILFKEAS